VNLLGNLNIAHLIVWYVVFVLSTTFHEFAHAYLAFRGGDLTAYQGGHLTLDPTPHIRRSPFGMVFVPIFSFLTMQWMIGWASVPFDPYWGKRHPRRQALMSLAGPAANLLLAIVAFVAIKALLAGGVFATPSSATFSKMVDLPRGTAENSPVAALAMALSVMLNLNVLLCLFNLLPIPPLDGAGVVEGAAPRATESFYDRLRSTPMLQVLGLVLAWHLFKYIAIPAFHTTVDLLYY
jgi:Zn-dependent protease